MLRSDTVFLSLKFFDAILCGIACTYAIPAWDHGGAASAYQNEHYDQLSHGFCSPRCDNDYNLTPTMDTSRGVGL